LKAVLRMCMKAAALPLTAVQTDSDTTTTDPAASCHSLSRSIPVRGNQIY